MAETKKKGIITKTGNYMPAAAFANAFAMNNDSNFIISNTLLEGFERGNFVVSTGLYMVDGHVCYLDEYINISSMLANRVGWFGLFVRTDMSKDWPEIVVKYHATNVEIAKTPQYNDNLHDAGSLTIGSTTNAKIKDSLLETFYFDGTIIFDETDYKNFEPSSVEEVKSLKNDVKNLMDKMLVRKILSTGSKSIVVNRELSVFDNSEIEELRGVNGINSGTITTTKDFDTLKVTGFVRVQSNNASTVTLTVRCRLITNSGNIGATESYYTLVNNGHRTFRLSDYFLKEVKSGDRVEVGVLVTAGAATLSAAEITFEEL